MTMVEIAFIIVGTSLIVSSGYFLYLTKETKVLIAWSIALAVTQIIVRLSDYEIRWMVLATLPFYLFAIIYMMIKLRMRINAVLKRIEEKEREHKENKNTDKEISHGYQRHLPQ